MRQPPKITDVPKYPVTAGTMLLATAITVGYLGKILDISPLIENGQVRRGELWRLVTAALPHADPLHLLFNLYWTWVFGTRVEQMFGHWRTVATFLLLAVVSGASEFALLSGGIGLSGVGYGLFGMLWVLSRRDPRFSNVVDSKTIQLFVGWFFFCIYLTYTGFPIGNIAHAVGCGTGAVMGWSITSKARLRTAGVASLAILLVSSVIGATIARPWVNISKYIGGETAKYADYDESRMGYEALSAQNNDEAIRWFKDAIRLNPNDPYPWFSLGIAYQRMSLNEQALEAYRKASTLAPTDEKYKAAVKALAS